MKCLVNWNLLRIRVRLINTQPHLKTVDECCLYYLLDMLCVVCCSVLQCVAVCCSVLQCVAVCCSVLQ